MAAAIRSIGKAFRYQYDAGAAIETDLVPTFCFKTVRNLR
jgi:hypothetical protein